MASQWKIAGYIFSIAAVVMLISLIMNVYVSFFKDYDNLDGVNSVAGHCKENDDSSTELLVCEPLKQERYLLTGLGLMSVGLGMACFARDSEKGDSP